MKYPVHDDRALLPLIPSYYVHGSCIHDNRLILSSFFIRQLALMPSHGGGEGGFPHR